MLQKCFAHVLCELKGFQECYHTLIKSEHHFLTAMNLWFRKQQKIFNEYN